MRLAIANLMVLLPLGDQIGNQIGDEMAAQMAA